MKKALLIIIISILVLSCKTHNITNNPNSAYIYKIDSLNDYYLIYAKRNDSIFKIVSKKEPNPECLTIKKGHTYILKLKSQSDVSPIINGVKIYSPDVDCYAFDDVTSICLEPDRGIFELYYTDNISGLCYLNTY